MTQSAADPAPDIAATASAPPEPAAAAAASEHRKLNARRNRLLRFVAGVHGFSAIASLVWAIALGSLGGVGMTFASILVLLALASGYLFVAIWRDRMPSLPWLFVPATLMVLAYGWLGLFTSSVLWLNAAAHIAWPFLRRTQRRLAELAPSSGA